MLALEIEHPYLDKLQIQCAASRIEHFARITETRVFFEELLREIGSNYGMLGEGRGSILKSIKAKTSRVYV